MFAQPKSSPDMLNGLITFIKINTFKNENELIEKLAGKVLCNVQELL